ncbi:hypothetical protein [Trinickia acidisoli]|uniref:hypothetical protein n=1 Tax=Trinickia acidisoli TaxID=2767482 RepID=UPI001A8C1D50|nr:hypothetical protein [Trinickia acidisoli]
MSDLHGVSIGATSEPEEIEDPQTQTNNPPVQSTSSRQNVGTFGAISSRNTSQAAGTTGQSGIRRSGALPQIGAATFQRRHSLSATDTAGIHEEISVDARRVATEFSRMMGLNAPIDTTSADTTLQGHAQRLTTIAQSIHHAFDAMGQMNASGGQRLIMQPPPDTPEIRAAQANLTTRTQRADTLEGDAQTLRTAATELRGVATQRGELAQTLGGERREAQREAADKHKAASDAETAAAKADGAATAKDGEAADAEKKAKAASEKAETLGNEAGGAEKAAQTAQSSASEQSKEADKAEREAGDAHKQATTKSDAADRAEEGSGQLREQAQAAAAAAQKAPEKERPAALQTAREADARATQAETAAKEQRAQAQEAAKRAEQLDAHAAGLREQAGQRQTDANKAKAHAQTVRSAADEAGNDAETLKATAKEIRGEATSLRSGADALARKVGPLEAAAGKAKREAQKAEQKETTALEEAQDADDEATQAEQDADEAERTARTARDEANVAGQALRDAIANAPVPSGSDRPASAPENAGNQTSATTTTPADTAARTGNTAAATGAATRSTMDTIAQWARSSANVVGQQAVAVGITTALREAVGAGVEALLTHTNASDEAKAGIAGGLYGAVILSNLMTMLYNERQGIGTPVTHAGNIAQIVSLSAAVTAAAATGTLKDLVPSLMKTFMYSGGRDTTNLYMPLGDNIPTEGKANPLTVQAVNSAFFYAANQMLVNSIQSFHGLSGAGLVDAMHDNTTDPNTHEAETLRSGFASLATYVVGNLAGETADQFAGRMLTNAMSGGNLADLQITLTPPAWPGAEKAFDTFSSDGVSRTSIFYTVYGLTAAIDPKITAPHLGEAGASWLQNCVGGAFIALLCLPAAMTAMKKARNAFGGGRTARLGEEEGAARFTSLTTPTNSPPRQTGEAIPMRNRGGGNNVQGSSGERA